MTGERKRERNGRYTDDRYGCNKQYVMILLKYQADKNIEECTKSG